MKKFKIISGILSEVFILFILIIFITERYSNYRFLVGSTDGDTLNGIFLVCSAGCLFVSAIAAIISKTERHIVFNSFIRFLCIGVFCAFALIPTSVSKDCEYYTFTSPDGAHAVVAEEWSYLLAGGVDFYERINPMLVICKENFSTDDGYRAISSGDYSVEWKENVMSITLQNGNNIYKTVNIIV